MTARCGMRSACALIIVHTALLHNQVHGASGAKMQIRSHEDLQRAIYTEDNPANACVRLLNTTHEVGCAGFDGQVTKGALVHWDNLTVTRPDGDGVVLLVPPALLPDALKVAASSKTILGLLVELGPVPKADSSAAAFPGAAYAPYNDTRHVWNPAGADTAAERYDLPVMLLGPGSGPDAARRAADNAQRGFQGAVHYAELRSEMSGRHNASACLDARDCLPLGGHSVWAALPPLPEGAEAGEQLPVTLVVASTDSSGFFHDSVVGAEAPLSGLVAMLAAADALGAAQRGAARPYARGLVFAALAGEPWGFMGSRRLLGDLHSDGDATAGLSLESIDQVVELSQLGRAAVGEGGTRQLFVHTQRRGEGFGDASAVVDALTAAAKGTQLVSAAAPGVLPWATSKRPLPTKPTATAQAASAGNPGVPPSSLFTLLAAKPALAGAVLADFDTAFRDPFYGSRFDNGSAVDLDSVAAAAAVAAGALHRLAAEPGAAALQVNESAIAASVAELAACLIDASPGLGCQLARRLTSPLGAPAQHYVGVLNTLTADTQDPDPSVKGDLPRFLWNFLAERTAAPEHTGQRQQCDFGEHACSDGRVCVGYQAALKWPASAGRCLHATARYVPSHSLALRCEGCDGANTFNENRWQVTNETDAWQRRLGWPADPMWTESNWPGGQPRLLLFQEESPAAVRFTVMAGIFLTSATAAAAAASWLYLERQAKRR